MIAFLNPSKVPGRTPFGRPLRRRVPVDRNALVPVRKQLCALLALAALVSPAPAQSPKSNLADRSLEDLMNVEVTSVSKKEQTLARTPAAIFVITQEDIRRSGATNIPDLLRMVPGVQVAQIDAHTWAISARGFAGEFSNKLLVMIDGRTVYNTTFSGVYWDQQDVPLEDIERIEVIRGQGAAVWGANAVNGVINIITKSAASTQGGLLTAGGGNMQQGFGTLQYGARLGPHVSYRAFGKYFNSAAFTAPDGQGGDDGGRLLHGGFRADAALNDRDSLTVAGDIYGGGVGTIFQHLVTLSPLNNGIQPQVTDLGGGDVLARWHRDSSSRSDFTLQGYFDRYVRDFPAFHERSNSYDLEFQHHLRLGDRHDFLWGLDYRVTSDATRGSPTLQFLPPEKTEQLFSAFVQDEFALVPARLWLTAGARFEHNDFTGFEIEPTVRLLWAPREHHALWLALSRATRAPSRIDNDLSAISGAFQEPSGQLVVAQAFGNPHIFDEEALDLEFGYRAQFSSRVSLDMNAFFSHYQGLVAFVLGTPFPSSNPPPPHIVVPEVATNAISGWSRGLEVSTSWKVTSSWTLSPGYSFLSLDLIGDRLPVEPQTLSAVGGTSPQHQAQLRSRWALPHNLEFDSFAAFSDRLPALRVPSNTRLDVRLGWHPGEHLEIAFVGQNLLRDRFIEFASTNDSAASSRIRRSGYVKFAWRF